MATLATQRVIHHKELSDEAISTHNETTIVHEEEQSDFAVDISKRSLNHTAKEYLSKTIDDIWNECPAQKTMLSPSKHLNASSFMRENKKENKQTRMTEMLRKIIPRVQNPRTELKAREEPKRVPGKICRNKSTKLLLNLK